jgi:predicted DNA-binding transcriptional regulator AlpA
VRYGPAVAPLLIDTREVSRLTGIPVQTLIYWRRTPGKGPRWTHIGRRVVYRPRDVESWIDSHYTDQPADPTAEDAPTTPTPTEG